MNEVLLLIALLFFFILGQYNNYQYKKILVSKADAPKRGQSNVEYILGKPYVILHEKDYVENCKVWYDREG